MTIVHLKGREAPKAVRSAMETLLFSRDDVAGWKLPPFQRPLRINSKVEALVEEIKTEGGVLPGVITLGRVGGDRTFWIVDGQHRIEAFKMSDLDECIADVRILNASSMAELAEEFARQNQRLVNMRPDDILRALEESTPLLRRIRESCDFVGYGQIRRGTTSAMIGMSQLLRSWRISEPETPANSVPSGPVLAASLDRESVDNLISFMQIARAAWGTDPESYRLWGTLNIVICMWIFRRHVLDKSRGGSKRSVVLTGDMFRKCLMSVAADTGYNDWLVGRSLNERDRSPCYTRVKEIFSKRLEQELGRKVAMVQPSWCSNRGRT